MKALVICAAILITLSISAQAEETTAILNHIDGITIKCGEQIPDSIICAYSVDNIHNVRRLINSFIDTKESEPLISNTWHYNGGIEEGAAYIERTFYFNTLVYKIFLYIDQDEDTGIIIAWFNEEDIKQLKKETL